MSLPPPKRKLILQSGAMATATPGVTGHRFWKFKLEDGANIGPVYCQQFGEAVRLLRYTWKDRKLIPNGWYL
jgi:hypothetical protein